MTKPHRDNRLKAILCVLSGVGLASAQMNYAQTSGLGFLMAQAVFASIPILIVYVIFQKQIVGAMAGAATR